MHAHYDQFIGRVVKVHSPLKYLSNIFEINVAYANGKRHHTIATLRVFYIFIASVMLGVISRAYNIMSMTAIIVF